MLRFILSALTGAFLLWPVGAALAESPYVYFDAVGDRLTVRAEDVSLNTLLARVSEESGVRFLAGPGILNRRVNIEFKDQALEKGLKRLVDGYNFALFYDQPSFRITMVKLLPFGAGNDSRLPPGTGLDLAVGGPTEGSGAVLADAIGPGDRSVVEESPTDEAVNAGGTTEDARAVTGHVEEDVATAEAAASAPMAARAKPRGGRLK